MPAWIWRVVLWLVIWTAIWIPRSPVADFLAYVSCYLVAESLHYNLFRRPRGWP